MREYSLKKEKPESPDFTPYKQRNSMDDSSKKADLHASFQNSLTDFLMVEKNVHKDSIRASDISKSSQNHSVNESIEHHLKILKKPSRHSKKPSSVFSKSDVTPRDFLNCEPISSDYN